MKDQQIQTEIVVTVDQDVQTGDTQGLHLLISAISTWLCLTLSCNEGKRSGGPDRDSGPACPGRRHNTGLSAPYLGLFTMTL